MNLSDSLLLIAKRCVGLFGFVTSSAYKPFPPAPREPKSIVLHLGLLTLSFGVSSKKISLTTGEPSIP